MPTITDSSSKRLIVRHRGPAGAGLPKGGSPGQIPAKKSDLDHDVEWVNPPDGVDSVSSSSVSSLNEEVPVFDGLDGKVIKGSGVPFSQVARVVQLNSKVDKEDGKGLSSNDLTDVLFDKLQSMSPSEYKGHFDNLSQLTSSVFPDLSPGDYASVSYEAGFRIYFWVSGSWSLSQVETPSGEQLSDLLFNSTSPWSKATSVVFTEDDKARLDEAVTETQLQSIAQQAGVVPPSYGALSFLGTFSVSVLSLSDGTNNYYKVNPGTVFSPSLSGFSNGGSNVGKMQYVAPYSPRVFKITGVISVSAEFVGRLVVALFRNDSALEPSSRSLVQTRVDETLSSVSFEAFISLATNDFIDVRVANLDTQGDVEIASMSLSAVSL